MDRCLFPCGKNFIILQDNSYKYGNVDGNTITYGNQIININEKILEIYETCDPITYVPGYCAFTASGNLFFHPYNDENSFVQLQSSFPSFESNSICLFPNQIIAVISNSQLRIFPLQSQESAVVESDIPNDSYFVAFNGIQSIICSRTENVLLLITYMNDNEFDITNLPGGYSNLTCAAIIDDNAFVFARNSDPFLYYYNWEDESIKMVETNKIINRIISCDVDSFESSCICLTSENEILVVRFKSNTCDILCENVLDYCIVHSPFDTIITLVNDESHKVQILPPNKYKKMDRSINQMIDALNSRVVSSLCELSKTRERLVLRQQLSNQNIQSILPDMITIFGDEPKDDELKNATTKDDQQRFWIENLTNDITFEIHSNLEIKMDSSVFITSNVASFESRISTEYNKDANFLSVSLSINLESLSANEGFQVFIKNDNNTYFVGIINLPINFLAVSNEIPRIEKVYRVTFPKTSFTTPKQIQEIFGVKTDKSIKSEKTQRSTQCLSYGKNIDIEAVEGGAILRISGDTCEHFSQRLCFAKSLVPEHSTFTVIDNQQKQIKSSFEVARAVSMFSQMPENPNAEKSLLTILRSDIDEGLSALYS